MAITLETRNKKLEPKNVFTYTLKSFSVSSRSERGFTLLVAVIFMSVMLVFGLALGSLAYKQKILSSAAVPSQYAFYAADAGLECALYADQQLGLFVFPATQPASAPSMRCNGASPRTSSVQCYNQQSCPNQWVLTYRFDLSSNTRCVDITVHKPSATGRTYLFSQGYDVSCVTVELPHSARFSARGIRTEY